jgi:hypothetical protein
MINLGIVDLILIVLFVLMIYFSFRRHRLGLTILIAVLLFVVLVERLAPGTLASIGTAIGGIDQVNAAGPHLQIQPIFHFQK